MTLPYVQRYIGIHTLEYQYLACSLSCSTPNPWCRQRPYTKHPKAIPLATYCGRQSVSRARPSTSSCSPTLDALNRTQSKLNNTPLGPLRCKEGGGSENVAYTVNSRFHRISVTVDSLKRIKTVVWTRIHRCVFDDNENAYLWKCIRDLSEISRGEGGSQLFETAENWRGHEKWAIKRGRVMQICVRDHVEVQPQKKKEVLYFVKKTWEK